MLDILIAVEARVLAKVNRLTQASGKKQKSPQSGIQNCGNQSLTEIDGMYLSFFQGAIVRKICGPHQASNVVLSDYA